MEILQRLESVALQGRSTGAGIETLGIDVSVMNNFKTHKPTGKLLLMAFGVRDKKQIPDLLKAISYKKKL
jgi:hypothetical protein